MAHAKDTKVGVSRTIDEIRKRLMECGCDSFASAEDFSKTAPKAGLMFTMGGRGYRVEVDLPVISNPGITHTPGGKTRTKLQRENELEKEVKRIWRALTFYIKGKLVAVEEGIKTAEQVFLPDMILECGQTVEERAVQVGMAELGASSGLSLLSPQKRLGQ